MVTHNILASQAEGPSPSQLTSNDIWLFYTVNEYGGLNKNNYLFGYCLRAAMLPTMMMN